MQEIKDSTSTGTFPTAFRPTAQDESLRPPKNSLEGTFVGEDSHDFGFGEKTLAIVRDDEGKLGEAGAEWSLQISGKILEDKYAAAKSQGLSAGYKVAFVYDGPAAKAKPGQKPANLWRLFMEAPAAGAETDKPPF